MTASEEDFQESAGTQADDLSKPNIRSRKKIISNYFTKFGGSYLFKFSRLVICCGVLAALASAFGKLGLDFGPNAPITSLSVFSLSPRIIKRDLTNFPPKDPSSDFLPYSNDLEFHVVKDCELIPLKIAPEGLIVLFHYLYKSLDAWRIGVSPTCSSDNKSVDWGDDPDALNLVTSRCASIYFCLVFLLRGICVTVYFVCNCLLLNTNIHAQAAAPTSAVCTVAVLAANICFSVILSAAIFKEVIGLRFVGGVLCLLCGIVCLFKDSVNTNIQSSSSFGRGGERKSRQVQLCEI